jgi:hypothetical protein
MAGMAVWFLGTCIPELVGMVLRSFRWFREALWLHRVTKDRDRQDREVMEYVARLFPGYECSLPDAYWIRLALTTSGLLPVGSLSSPAYNATLPGLVKDWEHGEGRHQAPWLYAIATSLARRSDIDGTMDMDYLISSIGKPVRPVNPVPGGAFR